MEAEESWSADGKRSGGQQQPLSETLLGAQLPQLQQQVTLQSVDGSLGRLQHRQPKRSEMLQRQKQQQQSQASVASWQLSDISGPSRDNCSAPSNPSPQVHNVQQTQSLPNLEVQEGPPCRKERKPPKPGKYVCTYCGRPCAKPSVLQKHIRSHTGERPYPCVPCGFSFKTKSNLYKHRKSHAHRIKAGMASSREEPSFSGPEGGTLGDEQEEVTEGESTGSEDETGQHQPSTSQGRPTLKKSCKVELSFTEEGPQNEDSHAVKQRLAMRLSERKRAPSTSSDETRSSLGPGSKGSTESGYFSRSGSAELSQVSPPNASAKTYAEIILGKYGRLGQQQRIPHQQLQLSSSGQQEKSVPFTVPKTQVIEHITKLITINEAVVDTSEIDSVKPRRSSLSRRSSIESVKFSSPKEPCVFEPKGDLPGFCGSAVYHIPGSFASELPDSYLAARDTLASQCSSAVLCRSQSVPSSANTSDSPSRSFRLSQSFDEQQVIAAEMRIGPHQRMLRRQPAIEVPAGVDIIIEDAGPSSRLKESDPRKKQEKEVHLYECELCGTRLKKQDTYAAHRVACMNKTPLGSQSVEGSAFTEMQPQIMSYKFKAMAMAVRKRKKKEESLEEDPPSPGPTAVSFSTQLPLTLGSTDNQGTPVLSQSETERRGPWKEISVIQHTRSFEKQESISMANQETKLEQEPSQEPKPTSTSRLIRQPKIQVPEILVTEEPDTEMVSPPASTCTSKEPEKVEEFQWPQRSQSLAQLPAEKLPPKKKRLRLAEATQSSGESGFESVSLPHSPSQESNVSHATSRSASFEESGRPDPEMQSGTWTSQSSHMLTVPSSPHQHHHSHKEMRRSTSEQAPASPPHPANVEEIRSKSFDYGCLSLERTSATWKERRKCLLVKHATLGEPDQEEPSASPLAKPGISAVCQSYPGCPLPTIREHRMGGRMSRISSDHIGKTLQLFQSPLSLPPSFFPLQQASPNFCSPSQLTRFFPVTTAISGIISTQMFHQAFIHSEPPQLHPRPLDFVERLALPLQPLSALLPLQSSDVTQTVCFPMPGGLTIQVPSGPLFRESRPTPSSLHSPGHSQQHLVLPHNPLPIIAPCLEQLAPVVSLVVPVRLQTHIPTYASAMYTTISQILATTQLPICCTAMVIMGKLEEDRLQRSYLRLPSPSSKSYIPLPLPLERGAGTSSDDSCWQLGAGGSKRMLSPAGSLELSLEAQRHQKRVKEEEVKEEDDKEDEDNKCDDKSQEEDQGKNKLTVETLGREKNAREVIETDKLSRQDLTQSKTEPLKQEEMKEVGHRCVSRVTSPERTMDPSYPTLHTTTSVSWCYLNYTKPNPSTHRDVHTSVYSSWSVSMHNPNLPGLSTKILLSLLHSKQKHSAETYTMATAPSPNTEKLVSTGSKKASTSEVHASPPNTPIKVKDEQPTERGEKYKSTADDTPATSAASEVARVCIFEGGYKSNEEYVYVRGRGRGKYVCGECGIRCKKPSMLKKHIRTHTDVRPYVCKHCNFAFKTKGNLTKHMKSKAHGKKCLEMGVSESSVDELETEETGGSDERVCESEDQEEHRFSDPEDSEEDDDDEEQDFSNDEPSSACSTDTRQSTDDLSEIGQGSQMDPCDPRTKEEYASPHRPCPVQAASPSSKRASFSRKGWDVSPRSFSPSSEGSPLRSLSPRLDLSSPSRHLSPSPERGLSPIRALSPLRPLSTLRPVSPAQYRSTRALTSPTPRKPHRPHSSPAGLFWEPCTPATKGQQDKPDTQQTPQERMPPDPCLVSSSLRFSPNEPFSLTPFTPRTVDRMFSHLPLHSQDQARMLYHMIPIGGIQMVQLRPRSRPKLERQSSSTTSPTSPKDDSHFSLARRDFPWISLSETSPQRTLVDSRTQSQDEGTSQSDLSCPSTSSTLAKPPPLWKGIVEQQTAKVRKQYGGSSSATKSRTFGHETPRKDAESDKEAERIFTVSQGEGASSSHETRQLHETEKPIVAPLRGRESSSEGSSGPQSSSAPQSHEGDPDST
ncbi:transcription factor HIVEP3-like [Myxocyprinus asiaticus]|uniref:transcription factor HIVEP3-like n=1 Tax=Myxocyprinus asiaticus TaxID=70543 RepID=UPI0022224757|nr:transcription factor HIVEP3-like [Myxocyprinus asiaticus]XP_051576037.1 transcription factor HIVEP3-like [Myxocyprinus asiaticus]XP_051576038.1 transcription factor HIVEP3-like [Myxocyprinus asiaticus]XP_051576039.1 transcription factor HIVEP3-like [Myxocyprinus asiaticus]XP_051576040.1 transcription factor HIVEP3-like [Myxocyprinus asiaticus]XP_051576041.1 transcription factor HIVEP3-like [Myxocyprinus asiaticus]